jgi:hypothetical protein
MNSADRAEDRVPPTFGRLPDAQERRVKQTWAPRLTVPVMTFDSSDDRLVPRDGATAVVVVELFGARVVVGPPHVMGALEGLETWDEPGLLSRLARFGPRPIGTAWLSYCQEPPLLNDVAIEPAASATAGVLRNRCPPDEWDESGLDAMPDRCVAFTPGGEPAAIAGYERWDPGLAHLGVATDPDVRGRGCATTAAGAAVAAALAEGLIAQWRCRVGNAASERLADVLGFTRVGRQTAVSVDIPAA